MKCKPPAVKLFKCSGCGKKHILTHYNHGKRCPCGKPYYGG